MEERGKSLDQSEKKPLKKNSEEERAENSK
jgi:hypothetical protein